MVKYESYLLVFLLLVSLVCVNGGIYSFSQTELSVEKNMVIRVGVYSPRDAPATSSPGNGNSFIEIIMDKIQREDSSTNGTFHFLTFHSDHKSIVGIEDSDGTKHLCCTTELVKTEKCTPGELLIKANGPLPNLWVETLSFRKNQTIQDFKAKYDIIASGIYYLYLINCPTSGLGTVSLDGAITFMNPYGYLNGELFAYMPFFGAVALFYLIIGVVWFILSIIRWRELLKLQHFIMAGIVLGMIENSALYFDNLGYNIAGQNYIGAMIVGVLISTLKRTFSRVFILVVAMGYGVVKPTLGNSTYKVLLLGFFYMIFSGALNIVDLVQRTTVVSLSVVFFLVFPVAVLDTAFYWWIFLSLFRTIGGLQARKQTIKLQMYKKLFMVLVVSGLISALIIIIQLFVSVSEDPDNSWRVQWLWTAFWHLLYLAILLAIVILWRPTSNNTRYSYSEVEPGPDEFTLQPLNVIGEVIQRKTKDENENIPRLNDSMNEPSFTITDDEEEKSAKMD